MLELNSPAWSSDIDILLVGPQGQNLIIMSDAGNLNAVNNINLTFDDSAAQILPDSTALVSGVYRPTNYDTGDTFPAPAPAPSGAAALATFNGTNPNGAWSLYIVDDSGEDAGSLTGGWCLNVAFTPTPTPTRTASPTGTMTRTPTPTATVPTSTGTPTWTPTQTATRTLTPTPTGTPTRTVTRTPTLTVSPSPTMTMTRTLTVTSTPTGTTTPSSTPTPTGTPTRTPTRTLTPTISPSPTGTITPTPTAPTCNSTPVSILDAASASPYPSTITLAGLGASLTDVNVQLLGLTHTWPDDIDVLLVGPQGQNLIVMSDAGGGTDVSNIDLTLNDSVAQYLPNDTALASGVYRPINYDTGDTFPAPAPAPSSATTLAIFNGTNPNGTWSLYIVDDSGEDAGSLTGGWCLNVAFTPTPTPTRTASPTGTATRTLTPTPTGTPTQTPTRTLTPTPTRTATPTQNRIYLPLIIRGQSSTQVVNPADGSQNWFQWWLARLFNQR